MAQASFGDDLMDILIVGAVLVGGYLVFEKISGGSSSLLPQQQRLNTLTSSTGAGSIGESLENDIGSLFGAGTSAGSQSASLFGPVQSEGSGIEDVSTDLSDISAPDFDIDTDDSGD
jgi:hypothetical protein